MRTVLLLVVLLAIPVLVATAAAPQLGPSQPATPAPASTIAQPPDPARLRQGGDDFEDAVEITLPRHGTGTTVGYNDDHDEMCPYGGSAPDVVYRFTAARDMGVDVDLCGSSYDTKTYVYVDAEPLVLLACADDAYGSGSPCGDYVSRILDAPEFADVYEFGYVLWTNLEGSVAVENRSWSGRKALFD